MMSLRTGTHQSVPTPQGLTNNIMHPPRIMGLGFSRWWLRAGDDERSGRHRRRLETFFGPADQADPPPDGDHATGLEGPSRLARAGLPSPPATSAS